MVKNRRIWKFYVIVDLVTPHFKSKQKIRKFWVLTLKNLIKMRSISGIFKPCACGANFRKIFINLQSGLGFCFANWGQPKSRFVDCCQRLLATTPFITCALTPVRPKESVKWSKKYRNFRRRSKAFWNNAFTSKTSVSSVFCEGPTLIVPLE